MVFKVLSKFIFSIILFINLSVAGESFLIVPGDGCAANADYEQLSEEQKEKPLGEYFINSVNLIKYAFNQLLERFQNIYNSNNYSKVDSLGEKGLKNLNNVTDKHDKRRVEAFVRKVEDFEKMMHKEKLD